MNEARSTACEFIAWQFVTYLSEREAINYLLHELPPIIPNDGSSDEESGSASQNSRSQNGYFGEESSPLLAPRNHQVYGTEGREDTSMQQDEFASTFDNLNALEIAAVCNAKRFLGQRAVQRIIERIWRGDIVFWETLSVDSVKEPKVYNKKYSKWR